MYRAKSKIVHEFVLPYLFIIAKIKRREGGENRNSKSDLLLTERIQEYILGITKEIWCLIRRPAEKDGRPTLPERQAPDFNYNAGLFTLIS